MLCAPAKLPQGYRAAAEPYREKQPKRQFVPLKEVKPGQEVVIAELNQHAVVLSRPDKNGMVEVRAGILKTKVPLTGLCAPDKMDKRTQKQEPPRTAPA